jgi:hypothetical protein
MCERIEELVRLVERERIAGMAFPCPCCRFYTLSDRGALERCPVCYWEDDGQNDFDANIVRGNLVSLSEARNNFADFGASDLLYIGEVRSPLPSERQNN